MSLDTVQKHYNDLLQAEADAKYWFAKYEAQVKAQHEQQQAEVQAEHARAMQDVDTRFSEAKANAQQRAKDVLSRAGMVAADWNDESWEALLKGQKPGQLPPGVLIGMVAKSFPNLGINTVPLVVPILNTGHLLLISQGAAKVPARQLLRNIATRLLLTMPPGSAHFTFVDPFGMGVIFPFSSVPKTIRGEAVLSEQEEIFSALRDLTIIIRNANEGIVPETTQFFIAADFPSRFNMDMLMRTITIAEQGIKAKLYLIIHVDSDFALPDGFDPAPLLNAASIVHATPEGFRANVSDAEYTFQPDPLPEDTRLQALLHTLSEAQ